MMESARTTASRKGIVRAQSCNVRATVVAMTGVPGIAVTALGSKPRLCLQMRPLSDGLVAVLYTCTIEGALSTSSPQSAAADVCEKTP